MAKQTDLFRIPLPRGWPHRCVIIRLLPLQWSCSSGSTTIRSSLSLCFERPRCRTTGRIVKWQYLRILAKMSPQVSPAEPLVTTAVIFQRCFGIAS